MADPPYQIERDSTGEVRVPKSAYYGAQTQRAVEDSPVSGIGFPPSFIHALAIVKYAAAVNQELGLLESKIAEAIRQAAAEIMEGKHDEVALAQKVLPPARLARILDPWRMTEPGIPEKD
jgi:fumarate hydratase class II